MELPRGIPIRECFTPEADENPFITDLIEWYISGDSGGIDGMGVAVMHDLDQDALVPVSNFRQRVMSWRTSRGGSYPDRLRVKPVEPVFRAYLYGDAFFHNKLGMLIRDQDWVPILESGVV